MPSSSSSSTPSDQALSTQLRAALNDFREASRSGDIPRMQAAALAVTSRLLAEAALADAAAPARISAA